MAVAQATESIPMQADTADPQQQTKHPKKRDSPLLVIVLILVAAAFCFPFVWLLLASFKPPADVFSGDVIPKEWTLENYRQIFKQVPIWTWMLNTLIVCALGVVSVVLSSSLVAYAFARLRFPGRTMFFALVMGTFMLPGSVIMIPTFLIWNELGLVNTLWPLWAGNLFGSAFYIFMIRQFMMNIPQDLMDAARIDGAGFFRIYWTIMLPLVRPALAAVAIFEFNAKWNDFMTPLIYLNDPDRYTLALGLATLKQNFQELGTSWSLLLTASVIFTIPMIIIFFMFQRYFIEGIAHSGIKG